MKLLLLHGPGKTVSRNKLISLKNKFDACDIVVFEGGIDNTNLQSILSTMPLLSNERLVILENPPEDLDIKYTLIDGVTLIFWFDHEVSEEKPLFQLAKKAQGEMLFFAEEKEVSVFPFLDLLGEKHKNAYLELQKLKNSGFDTQYIITMIFYLLRTLAVDNRKSPSFVQKKLSKQRQNFKDLPGLYKYILETDFKIKSGLLENSQAEFLLVNKFLE